MWKNFVCHPSNRRDTVHIIDTKRTARLENPMHFIHGKLCIRIMVDAHIASHKVVLTFLKWHMFGITLINRRLTAHSVIDLLNHPFGKIKTIELDFGLAFGHVLQKCACAASDINQRSRCGRPYSFSYIFIIVFPIAGFGQYIPVSSVVIALDQLLSKVFFTKNSALSWLSLHLSINYFKSFPWNIWELVQE